MRRPILGALLGIALAALACNIPLSPQPTSTPSPTSTNTPTPTPTPSPTPAPELRNAAGRTALAIGDWDRALREFDQATTESSDPAVLGEALYGKSQAFLNQELWLETESVLNELLQSYPDHERAPSARILRARALESMGNPEVAIADLEAYLAEGPGVIDLYVHEWLGDLKRQAFRPLEAIADYEAALLAPGQTDFFSLGIKIGLSYLEGGNPGQALEQFDALSSQTSEPTTLATLNYLAADALEGLGDLDGMYSRYLESFEKYPAAFDTYTGLIRLVQDGIPVDDFQRGLVDYHAGAYEPAIAALTRSLATVPTAEAYYYRGLSYLEFGSPELALQDLEAATLNYPEDPIWAEAMLAKARIEWAWLNSYSAALDTYLEIADAVPEFPVAADALFAAGRTAERSNDLLRAAQIWLRLAEEHPGRPLAHDGGFEAGVALYRLGNFEEARLAFERALELAQNSAQIARSNLWIGKSQEQIGDPEAAELALQAAAGADPTGYYSLRAQHLLEGAEPFAVSGPIDFADDLDAEKGEAEQWMRSTFGITELDPLDELGPVLGSDPRLLRGLELWNLGMLEEARDEFSALRTSLIDDPENTYRLMHALLDLGLYREAIIASRQILNHAGLDDAGTLQAPVYFNRIRFGPYFSELILPEAANYGLNGLFLLSVVRQESLFEGFATSVAAARGLMQVIPSTGESIASQLGWPEDYQSSDLYRPIVSVRFGTHYLSEQSDRFDGDLYAALAAYNGGPGNALAWKELAPDDPDLFLEVIRFAETHRYIQVIYEAFEIYKSLYSAG